MKRTNLWKVALAALSLSLMLAVISLSGSSLLQADAQDGVTLELVAQFSQMKWDHGAMAPVVGMSTNICHLVLHEVMRQ